MVCYIPGNRRNRKGSQSQYCRGEEKGNKSSEEGASKAPGRRGTRPLYSGRGLAGDGGGCVVIHVLPSKLWPGVCMHECRKKGEGSIAGKGTYVSTAIKAPCQEEEEEEEGSDRGRKAHYVRGRVNMHGIIIGLGGGLEGRGVKNRKKITSNAFVSAHSFTQWRFFNLET